jgi:hypothetical protein
MYAPSGAIYRSGLPSSRWKKTEMLFGGMLPIRAIWRVGADADLSRMPIGD